MITVNDVVSKRKQADRDILNYSLISRGTSENDCCFQASNVERRVT